MSKRKKKKINKKIIQERLRNLQASTGAKTETVRNEEKKIETKKKDQVRQEINAENNYLLSDMKKVFFVSLLILVIFVVLVFLSYRADYLDSGGVWLFRILSVGQL